MVNINCNFREVQSDYIIKESKTELEITSPLYIVIISNQLSNI